VFWRVGVEVEGWVWNLGYGVGVVLRSIIRLDMGSFGDNQIVH
jgi:hypothetical protein